MTNREQPGKKPKASLVIEEPDRSMEKDRKDIGRRTRIPKDKNALNMSATEKDLLKSTSPTFGQPEKEEMKKIKKMPEEVEEKNPPERLSDKRILKYRKQSTHSESALRTETPSGYTNASKTETQLTETEKKTVKPPETKFPDQQLYNAFRMQSDDAFVQCKVMSSCKVSSNSKMTSSCKVSLGDKGPSPVASGIDSQYSEYRYQSDDSVVPRENFKQKESAVKQKETKDEKLKIDDVVAKTTSDMDKAIRTPNPLPCPSEAKTECSLGVPTTTAEDRKPRQPKGRKKSKVEQKKRRKKRTEKRSDVTQTGSKVEAKICVSFNEVAIRDALDADGVDLSRTEVDLSSQFFDSEKRISVTERTNAPDGMDASATELNISISLSRRTTESKRERKEIPLVEYQVVEDRAENFEKAIKETVEPKKDLNLKPGIVKLRNPLKVGKKKRGKGLKKRKTKADSQEPMEKISIAERAIRERISGDLSKTEPMLPEETSADKAKELIEVKKVSEGQLKPSFTESSAQKSTKILAATTEIVKRDVRVKEKSEKVQEKKQREKYTIAGTFRINVERQKE